MTSTCTMKILEWHGLICLLVQTIEYIPNAMRINLNMKCIEHSDWFIVLCVLCVDSYIITMLLAVGLMQPGEPLNSELVRE